jgi:hypothetical protein
MDKYTQEKGEKLAKDYIDELAVHEQLQACFFIVAEDGVGLFPIPPTPPGLNPIEFKEVTETILKAILKMLHATGYIFVMEAWSTISRKCAAGLVTMEELPLDDKTECIFMFSILKNEKKVKSWRATVHQTPRGRKIGELTAANEEIEGRFIIKDW